VGLSSDGNTAIVGGWNDNGATGAAWVYTRSAGVWAQQGSKLVGAGAIGYAWQGYSVALSGDGATAIVGGPVDNGSYSTGVGAAWVFASNGAVPTIGSVSPNSATAGGPAFTLTVSGSAYVSGSAAQWNGSALSTTFVGVAQLAASVPANLIASPGTANVTVVNPGGVASNAVTFTILPSSGPTILAGGVVNGASFAKAPAPVAPGSIAAIFGTALAGGTGSAPTFPLPLTMQNTQVFVNGIAAPLFFVSPSQINAQVPWEAGGASSLSVQVMSSGAYSNFVSVPLASAAPGIFGPSGGAMIVHVSDSTLVTASNPATPGEYLTIYCTGLGTVTNPPATGAAAVSSPLSFTTVTPTTTIGGIPAPVIFSGLAPGFVGLYQVNIQVPLNVATAGAAPLVLSSGGNSTAAAIAVQSGGPQVVQVSILPATASVQTRNTVQFTATVTGASNLTVTWSVNGSTGGNSTLGTVSNSGLYTAPSTAPNPNTVTVTATSVADSTKSASATVTITPATGTAAMTLSASSISFGNQALQTMSPAQTILLTSSGTSQLAIGSIAVSGTNGTDFLQFNNCPGSAGVLSAGATCFINLMFNPTTTVAESATLTITDNASGSPQVVGLSGQGIGRAVTIMPATAAVEINHSVPFIQNVAGVSDTGVTWSATAGTISAGGLYTAPPSVPTANTATVTVTSQSDPSLSASATVTIVPKAVSVLVSPPSASVQAGGSEVVTAAVVDTSNTAVTWSVNGVANGNSAVGTITASGSGANVATYIAPAILPSSNPVSITAASAADPAESGSASITVTSGSGIVLTSLDKTSLQPFNLLTISGAGFNPQAAVTVNFWDSTGYSLNVSPVSVGANSVVVGVPPYISVSGGDFAAGSVNIQVSQTLGSSTVTSNALSGFQIPNLPTLSMQPGAVTLALLTAQSNFSQFLINHLSQVNPATPLNTPEMHGALTVLASGLGTLISEISDVVQNPTHTFTLGVASGNTLTVGSSELTKADRMLLGMLSAQAAAGYVDAAAPACGAEIAANEEAYLSGFTASSNSQPDFSGLQQNILACGVPYAATTTTTLVGASVGVTTAGAGLLFGGAAAMASAMVSGQVLYITTTLGLGLAGVGAALGQGSTYAQALVQTSVEIIDDYLRGVVTSTIVSTTFGEKAGNLFDLAVSTDELHHAFEAAPPYNGGPSAGTTSTLTVSATGTGTGTIESYPGGLVCGGPDSTVCVVPFPTGETVYLDSEPASGSSFSGFSGACSGSSCEVTMSSNQTVVGLFPVTAPPPSGESVSPSNVNLGTLDQCSGGQISGTFKVSAPAGTSWTVFFTDGIQGGDNSVPDQGYLSESLLPSGGTGSGTFTVTISAQAIGAGCHDGATHTFDGSVSVLFLGPYAVVSPNVTWSLTYVTF
jgi:uncharacterized protein (TIGR03437 family)